MPKAAMNNSQGIRNEDLNLDLFENAANLQPVGKIQQIRKKIYEASIATRNKLNGQ